MAKPINILITGGTGFIGSRLALRCAADGYAVRVFALGRTETEQENMRTVEILGSVTEADRVQAARALFRLHAAGTARDAP